MAGIRESFNRILDGYASARNEPFQGHELARFIRAEFANAFLTSTADDYPTFSSQGSAGKGGWADAPWIAVYDPIVTDTAQEGYYPVYLFTRSLDAIYLSLNQGMATLRSELGAEPARDTLRARATTLRARLRGKFEQTFSAKTIDLQPVGASTRLAFYEPCHALGKRYDRHALPSEEEFVDDARAMVRLYALATAFGGTSEIDEIMQPEGSEPEPGRWDAWHHAFPSRLGWALRSSPASSPARPVR